MADPFRTVVLESPYAGDIDRNARYLRACMADCLRRGEAPFASHGLYTQPGVLRDDVPEERARGIAAGFAIGAKLDARVVYLDLGMSSGMRAGMREAERLGQPVEERRLGGEWAKPARPPEVFFFGVWPGTGAGHYLRNQHGRRAAWADDMGLMEHLSGARPGAGGLYPWTMEYGDRDRYGPQVEGRAWHWTGEDHRGKPMTLLTLWDRSEDRRGNCCSSFVVMAAVTPEEAMRAARGAFPAVFERIEAHLGRAVVLAGEVAGG